MEEKYIKANLVYEDCDIRQGHKIKLYGKETTVSGFHVIYNDALGRWETIILTEGRGDPFERSLADIEVLEDQPDESPALDWAKEYDTLYYIVMPVLNKLRHSTDNDTRMMERGGDIRDTIHKALADIKKLPPPISSNEPPFLVQSDAIPAAAREEAIAFAEWCSDNGVLHNNENIWYTWGFTKAIGDTGKMYKLFKQQKENP